MKQPESARLAPTAHDVIAATDPRAWQADASPAITVVTSCLGNY
jgi:hypothetical protein